MGSRRSDRGRGADSRFGFEEEDADSCCPVTRSVCDDRAGGLIFNFIREYADLESVNIGRVAASISRSRPTEHRGVYLAEIHQRGSDGSPSSASSACRARCVGTARRGKDLLSAFLQSEEYTESILDRRLACRQLGMRLPAHLWARKLCALHTGIQEASAQRQIWSTYFERDYVPGLATDKIPRGRFSSDAFAMAFARVLGHAAAPNLIVGRCDLRGQVVFDDGDELIIEDVRSIPDEIVVTDQTGTFSDCNKDLAELIGTYADCVERERAAFVPNARSSQRCLSMRSRSDFSRSNLATASGGEPSTPSSNTNDREARVMTA